MFQEFDYQSILASSHRAAWQIEDVIRAGDRLDFNRPFLPEALARVASLDGLSAAERLTLNHIRAHEYLGMFGLVEEFILPFVLDHAGPTLFGDDYRVRAMLQFAAEEAKHIQLFKRFHAAFVDGFEIDCAMIGPAEAIASEVLGHDPLAVALVVLQVEWMTQSHYVDSVRKDSAIDPLFKSLLRHHWMEEAQHARLDTLMVHALAEGRAPDEIDRCISGYFDIVDFLDRGLASQAELNLAAFERVAGRSLGAPQRTSFLKQQHQASRWTFIGSGMVHPRFRATLAGIAPDAMARLDAAASIYA